MPYIKQEDRRKFELVLETLGRNGVINTAGELNYLITSITHAYVRCKGESYQTYNDILGALRGVELELYRRKIGPYEDKKIKENGDV